MAVKRVFAAPTRLASLEHPLAHFPPEIQQCHCFAAAAKRRCSARVRGFLTQNKYLIAAFFPAKPLFFLFFFVCVYVCFDKAGQIKRCSRTVARANCLPLFEQEAFFRGGYYL